MLINTYPAKISINSQSAICTQPTVCILYPISSLHFVLTGVVLLFFFERASSLDRNIGAPKKKHCSETILAAMIDFKKAISLSHFQLIQAHFVLQVWTVCWRAPVEKHNHRAMITLYQLKTNANARLTSLAACLWCSSSWSRRVLEWTCYELLTFTKWGGVACFRSRSTMQFPSTEYNFRPGS